jgi:hypothetical protein
VKTASPLTQLSFRGVAPAQLASLRVVGSRSGRHRGRIAAHSDGRGASFLPVRPFRGGERVTVGGNLKVVGAGSRGYSFRVARFVPDPRPSGRRRQIAAVGTMRLATRPDLRPPVWDVRAMRPGASDAEIFVGPKLLATRRGQQGAQIIDAAGRVRFWRPMPVGQDALDVRVQTYRGRPVMTWWQGRRIVGQGRGTGLILDAAYRVIKRVRMGNGYGMDLHEFLLTPRGTALAMAYQGVRYDLRPVGGRRNGRVTEAVIQEIDLATGLVVFEWHSLGNVALTESDRPLPPRRVPWDYFHANSVVPDGDDGIVVSARSTSAVYRIDRTTGRIDWRLGGTRSDFRLGRGASFARQHDAQVQADGRVRIFDNSDKEGRRRSRVITLGLDRRAGRATLVGVADRHDLFAGTQGNAEVLPSGNLFVGWGSRGGVSEIDRSNRRLFDAWLPRGWDTYRAFRRDWIGAPRDRPTAAARAAGPEATRVYASWNGATEVVSWRVLAGTDRDALSEVGQTPWRNLETEVTVGSSAPFFAVQALDAAGRVLSLSHITRRR